MTQKTLKVVGVGNAIVDVLVHAEDAFLTRHGLTKGGMTLGDGPTAEKLYADMPPGIECSGGSVGNTVAGLGALGASAGYIGKVSGDELGDVFAHDLRSLGVRFATPRADNGEPTARSLVMVTPDAQRTMYTSLGAAITLTAEDVDEDLIASAEVLLLEGYLFDVPEAAEACRYALELAAKHGTKRALTVADAGCVERHQEVFQDMVNNHLDIVFANEIEAQALSGLSTTDEAVRWAAQVPALVVVTRSEKGSLVVDGGDPVKVDAVKPERLEDTTGAGDLYAAGFLYGLTHGFDHGRCGQLGSLLAAETISHIGARPQSDISRLVAKAAA